MTGLPAFSPIPSTIGPLSAELAPIANLSALSPGGVIPFAVVFEGTGRIAQQPLSATSTIPLPATMSKVEQKGAVIEGEETALPDPVDVADLHPQLAMALPSGSSPQVEPAAASTVPRISEPSHASVPSLVFGPGQTTPMSASAPPEILRFAKAGLAPEEPLTPRDPATSSSSVGEKAGQGFSGPMLPVVMTELTQMDPSTGPDRLMSEASPSEQMSEARKSTDPASHLPRTGTEGQSSPERQIVTAVTTSASGRTEILLDPQDLGRVRVSLDGNEASLVVMIEAEKPETIDLLRRNADILIEEFREAGYTSLSFNFAQHGDDTPQTPASPPDTEDEPKSSTRTEIVTMSAITDPKTGLTTLDLRL